MMQKIDIFIDDAKKIDTFIDDAKKMICFIAVDLANH
jgi:hypothetical protein